jgi:DNA-binding CsgD family transcriptional regulator
MMFVFSRDFKAVAPWAFAAVLSCWLWFWIVGYSPAFVGQGALPLFLPNAERLAFFLLAVLAGVGCALSGFLGRATLTSNTMFPVAMFALLLMGTSAFALSGYQTLLPPSVLATLGTALMGFGYGWALVLTQQVLFKSPSDWDIAFLYVLTIAAAIIILALTYFCLSTDVQAILPIFLALTWGVSLLKAQNIQKADTGAEPKISDRPLPAVVRMPLSSEGRYHLAQLIAVCIIVIALRSVGNGGLWGSFREASPSFNFFELLPALSVAILFLLVALPMFWFHTRSKRHQGYQIPILVFIGILLVLLFLEEHFSSTLVFSVLATTADKICLVIFCFTVVSSARRLPYPSQLTLGLAVSFNHLVALLWMVFFETPGLFMNLIVLLISYALVLLVAFRRVTPENSYANCGKATGAMPATNSDGFFSSELQLARCQDIAALHGLTRREAEIFALLAQGRSVPYIQTVLTLSEGTVRTHVSHIYSKLGVHTKQELIDLLAVTG